MIDEMLVHHLVATQFPQWKNLVVQSRGRAWTLWKAMIVAAGLTNSNAIEGKQCWRIMDEVITEHKQSAR